MTFPVGFHSAVIGLSATVGGRTLVGRAKPKEKAREVYEEALERGELAVLHEEPLRGLNVISIAPLPPGVEVEVCAEIVTPLTLAPGGLHLRLPMTIGEVYGDSPLLPADDVLATRGLAAPAILSVRSDTGNIRLADGRRVDSEGVAIELTTAIELTIEGGRLGALNGRAADGRAIELTLSPTPLVKTTLSCAILFDHSGSTSGRFPRSSCTVWQAMRDGLAKCLADFAEDDQIALWEFDDQAHLLGDARGPRGATALIQKLQGPSGGTNLIGAVMEAANAGAAQILVLTDGQTWATQAPPELGACVHAVLVGSESLDAGIGHLATQTGGAVFYASGDQTAAAISAGIAAMRAGSSRVMGQFDGLRPQYLSCVRSGVTLTTRWSPAAADERQSDAVGRFVASLALPLFTDTVEAGEYAAAHDLACHLTSLVLVDTQTTSEPGLPRTIRQPLALEPDDCEPLAFMRRSTSAQSVACSASEAPIRAPRLPVLYDMGPSVAFARKETPKRKSFLERIMGGSQNANPAGGIDWHSHSADFLNGDLTALPPDVLALLQEWVREDAVQRIARQTGRTALLVALALYVEREAITFRNARRLRNKVLARLSTKEIQEALAPLSIA